MFDRLTLLNEAPLLDEMPRMVICLSIRLELSKYHALKKYVEKKQYLKAISKVRMRNNTDAQSKHAKKKNMDDVFYQNIIENGHLP